MYKVWMPFYFQSGNRGKLKVLAVYHEPHFTFRFDNDRIIPRFHLEGPTVGQSVSVFRIDPETCERFGLIATALVGEGGWVELSEPIIVRAGDAFVAEAGYSGCSHEACFTTAK